MAESGNHAGDVDVVESETMLRFVMTVIVSTLMVAVTAWVLSYAVLAPERLGSTHAAIHTTRS